MASGLGRVVLGRPGTIIGSVIFVTLCFSFLATELQFKPSVEKLLSSDSSTVKRYKGFRRTFGGDDLLVLVITHPESLFNPKALARIDALTRRLEQLGGVNQVLSLSNVHTPGPIMPFATLQPAYSRYPKTEAGAWAFGHEMSAIMTGILISADQRIAANYIHLEDGNVRLVDEIETELGDFDFRYHLVGSPKVKHALIEAAVRDTMVAFFVTSTLVALALAVLFRSPWAVALPLFTVVLAIVWVAGFMAFIGVPINSWTALIAPLVLVIGVAGAIHILAGFQRRCGEHPEPVKALQGTLEANIVPCALSALTTMLGFLSLMFGNVPVLKEFGYCAAFGVGVVFVLSVTFLPACLRIVSLGKTCEPRRGVVVSLKTIEKLVLSRPVTIIAMFLVLSTLFAYGVSRLKVDTDFLDIFHHDHEIAVSTRYVESHLGGTAPLEIVVSAKPGQIRAVNVLQSMDRYQRYLESLPLVERTFSVVELVKLTNLYLMQGSPYAYAIPANQATIDGFAFLSGMYREVNGVHKLISPDDSDTRILVRLRRAGTAAVTDLISEIEQATAAYFPPGITARVTGTTVVFTEAANNLVKSQISSFTIALVTICVTIMLVFRSLRIGLYSIAPNLFPILLVFGVMGFRGVSLDFFNAMIASISIGIAVDDSIHFLARYRREVRQTGQIHQAVSYSIREVGMPIVATSMIVGFGFLGLSVSATLGGTARFASYTALAICAALVATLALLPALLVRFWRPSDRVRAETVGAVNR